MDILSVVKSIIAEVLDIDPDEIRPETYVIRDLDAESIDLLEFSVDLGGRFGFTVDDDAAFLRVLRIHLEEAEGKGLSSQECLQQQYPWLSQERIAAILAGIDGGPVLQVGDIVSYIQHCTQKGRD